MSELIPLKIHPFLFKTVSANVCESRVCRESSVYVSFRKSVAICQGFDEAMFKDLVVDNNITFDSGTTLVTSNGSTHIQLQALESLKLLLVFISKQNLKYQ